jgi:hypothetical protein
LHFIGSFSWRLLVETAQQPVHILCGHAPRIFLVFLPSSLEYDMALSLSWVTQDSDIYVAAVDVRSSG